MCLDTSGGWRRTEIPHAKRQAGRVNFKASHRPQIGKLILHNLLHFHKIFILSCNFPAKFNEDFHRKCWIGTR
jgi:hypothetical protein